MKTIARIFGLMLLLVVTGVPGIASAEVINTWTGTIYVYNKDCANDARFHIYGPDGKECSAVEEKEIGTGVTTGVSVIEKYEWLDSDIHGVEYTFTKDCDDYAVEAIGEVAGGFKHEVGTTITCQMKQTAFWKQCRCN